MSSDDEQKVAGGNSSAHYGWHLKAGVVLLGLSVAVPLLGVPVVGILKPGRTLTAALSGGAILAGELLGIAAVAVMGKPGYIFLKGKVAAWLKHYGPPQTVSRRRYHIGLMLFCIPLLYGWVSVYIAGFIPAFQYNPLPYALVGDLMFIASFFVLGGEFWDKLQSLFRHNGIYDRGLP